MGRALGMSRDALGRMRSNASMERSFRPEAWVAPLRTFMSHLRMPK